MLDGNMKNQKSSSEVNYALMSEEHIHNELIAKMAVVETKVDGINRRLDISNGRIAKNENAVNELKIADIELKNTLEQFNSFKAKQTAGIERIKYLLIDKSSTIMTGILLAYLLWKFGL
jgi:hypothetical protein